MAVSTIVVLLIGTWLTHASARDFQWSDCGSDPNINVKKMEMTPSPLVLPGPMHFSVQANMNRSLQDVELHLSIKRNTFLIDLPIPCLFHIGSCTYEMSCSSGQSLLGRMISENWAGVMADVGQQIQGLIQSIPQLNITACPVPPASFDVHDYTINMPAVPSVLSFFANGDYSATVLAVDKSSGRNLLCIKLHVTIQQKEEPCTGFFCG